jgi:transposase
MALQPVTPPTQSRDFSCQLTPSKRGAIVFAIQIYKQKEVARIFNISQGIVSKLKKLYREQGNIYPKP